MEERARAREKLEKDVRKGFELIFSPEFERAAQYARKHLDLYPEDDRFHDILLNTGLALGDYDAAFQIARKRWQPRPRKNSSFRKMATISEKG